MSQLVRSPGVYFGDHPRQDPAREGHRRRQDDPGPRCVARVRGRQEGHRLRPHRPQAQAAGHDPAQGARLRRDRRGAPHLILDPQRQPLRVDAQHARQGQHRERRRGVHRHLPQAAPGRAADARLGARSLLENLFFNPKRYDMAKVGRHKVTKKLGDEYAEARRSTQFDLDGPATPTRSTGPVDFTLSAPTSSPRSRTS